MKKRVLLSLTAIAFVALMASAQTTGQSTTPSGQGQGRGQGTAWVDADKDGVCDNYTAGTAQHMRAGKGNGTHQGRHACNKNGQGRHKGNRTGNGQGSGANYVDNNNNGVCDNNEKQAEQAK